MYDLVKRPRADAVPHLLKKHVTATNDTCPSLKKKDHHVLLLAPYDSHGSPACRRGADGHALWLGLESIETPQIYLDADLELKERILAKTIPFDSKPGKFRANGQLLTFLNHLYEPGPCR